jgi:GNAT superfamily N-acetyltransferase
MPALVDLLRAVHHHDGYPRYWPKEPALWLDQDWCLESWVAAIDDHVIGHISLGASRSYPAAGCWTAATGLREEDLGVMSRLFVHPDWRETGVASRLVERLVERCDVDDLWPVLDVATTDLPAIDFYERLGWRRVGTLTAADAGQLSVHAYVAPRHASS